MRRKYVESYQLHQFHGCFTLMSDVTTLRAEWSGIGKGPIFCEIVLCGVKLHRRNSYVMTSVWLERYVYETDMLF